MKKTFLIFSLALVLLIGCKEKKEVIVPQENLFFIIYDVPYLDKVNLPYDVHIAYLKKKNILSYTIYDSSRVDLADNRIFFFYDHKDSAVIYNDFKNDRTRVFYYNGDNLVDSVYLYYHKTAIDTPDYRYIYEYQDGRLNKIVSDYISVYDYQKDLTVIRTSQNPNSRNGISLYVTTDSLFYKDGRMVHAKYCSNKIKVLADVNFMYKDNRLIGTSGKAEFPLETNFNLSYTKEGNLAKINGIEFIYDCCGIVKQIIPDVQNSQKRYDTKIVYR